MNLPLPNPTPQATDRHWYLLNKSQEKRNYSENPLQTFSKGQPLKLLNPEIMLGKK